MFGDGDWVGAGGGCGVEPSSCGGIAESGFTVDEGLRGLGGGSLKPFLSAVGVACEFGEGLRKARGLGGGEGVWPFECAAAEGSSRDVSATGSEKSMRSSCSGEAVKLSSGPTRSAVRERRGGGGFGLRPLAPSNGSSAGASGLMPLLARRVSRCISVKDAATAASRSASSLRISSGRESGFDAARPSPLRCRE